MTLRPPRGLPRSSEPFISCETRSGNQQRPSTPTFTWVSWTNCMTSNTHLQISNEIYEWPSDGTSSAASPLCDAVVVVVRKVKEIHANSVAVRMKLGHINSTLPRLPVADSTLSLQAERFRDVNLANSRRFSLFNHERNHRLMSLVINACPHANSCASSMPISEKPIFIS